MRRNYRQWLVERDYGANTIAAQLHRAGRVEEFYGDLDQHYQADRLESVLRALQYSTDDERRNRLNPSKIPIDGNLRNNLASYRNAIVNYRAFCAGAEDEPPLDTLTAEAIVKDVAESVFTEEIGQRLGLERDMQAALRLSLERLEAGLSAVDGGGERSVESGRIDITARDASGATVVIELKAGTARPAAIAQVLSYMGDVAIEEPDNEVRGILVASDFDKRAVAAARMAPALMLKSYKVSFVFSDPDT